MKCLIDFITLSPCGKCLSQIKTGRTPTVKPSFTVSESLIGISSKLTIRCDYCDDDRTFCLTSTENANIRFQHAMYAIGVNLEKSNRFLANMDMPPFVSSRTSAQYRHTINEAVKTVA